MPQGKQAIIPAQDDSQGKSLNGYINEAIDEKMEREE